MLPSEKMLEGEVGSGELWGCREIRQPLCEGFRVHRMRVKANPVPGNATEYTRKSLHSWMETERAWRDLAPCSLRKVVIHDHPCLLFPSSLCLGLRFPHSPIRGVRQTGREDRFHSANLPPLHSPSLPPPTSVARVLGKDPHSILH